jgi:hypothetical protein
MYASGRLKKGRRNFVGIMTAFYKRMNEDKRQACFCSLVGVASRALGRLREAGPLARYATRGWGDLPFSI